jgi:Fe-Mn family superoxide dismutase
MDPHIYKPKEFHLSGLKGISDKTLEMHFKLYEGYVKETNRLTEEIAEILKKQRVDQEKLPAYAELKRRLGFEYNGMVLHEYYFENLKKDGGEDPSKQSNFHQLAGESYGSYKVWKEDFIATGNMRGVGWAICYEDTRRGILSNHWISLHEEGNIAGFKPILVMDVWEHAYLLDYKPAERGKYIEAFFSNVNWNAAEKRLSESRAGIPEGKKLKAAGGNT